jgi:hypothetical protein
MLLFKLRDLVLPAIAFLGLLQSVLLLSDDLIRRDKDLFDLFLVRVVVSSLNLRVLFVFRVQVKDDLCELSDLLRHLVMSLF